MGVRTTRSSSIDDPITQESRMTTLAMRRAAAPLVGGLLALLIAACSSAAAAPSGVATLQSPDPSGSGDPRASPSASLSPEDAALAFARCMREHGIPMDDPKVGGGANGPISISIGGPGIDTEKLEAAQEACGGFMGVSGPKGTMPPDLLDKLVEYASCMREHGIDFPDPQTNGGGVIIGGPGSKDALDPSSPKFQAAHEACRSIMPDGGPGFTVGGSSTDVGPKTTTGG
jgi:hypothetical protein